MSKTKNIIEKYNSSEIEAKWQKIWEKEKIYSPDLDKAIKPFYNLMMFPYPSAEGMHVGNMYAFTGADVYGRFQRMHGNNVFEPIGLDGFGIHSENYAIKTGKHPVEQVKISEKNFYKQLKSIGNSFDWSHTVETYKPEYYKWTQWLFIQLFKAGLAYRKKAPVNFCPSCKTVLADEQVEDGLCERCNSVAEKRDLEQWFFKITKYADRLLYNLTQIDWSEKIKIAQKLWIGKSEGVNLRFKVKDMDIHFEMFDSIPQTFMAQTFTVIAPEHPMVYELVKNTEYEKAVMEFVGKIKRKKAAKKFDIEKEAEGISTGRYIEYAPTGKSIPIWVASYAIYDYGTGIVNCSVHDERDFAFAKKYNIPLHPVMFPQNPVEAEKVKNLEYCYHHAESGVLQEPAEFLGRKWGEVRKSIIEYIENKGFGKRETTYHLRDWLISRQRYWGPPIPMIYCNPPTGGCGWQPVPEKDLPVLLPFIKDYKPLGTGKAPLENHPEFYRTTCPKCGGPAKRETDVSDTFLDSSWYFLRYVSTDIDSAAFDRERVKKWLPVNMYIGGAEHSVLHLLYSRFITMVLKDLGKISFEEPFAKFRAHGLIVKDSAKMSKSKGNVVIPDEYIRKFGADTLRTYLMFMGPFSQGGDFRDTGIEGMHRFLRRVWTLAQKSISNFQFPISNESQRMMHKTIKEVTEDISNLLYNTSIAVLMEWYNFLSQQESISKEEIEVFLKLLAPFAPHISEELYQLLSPPEARQGDRNEFSSIHVSTWPTFDPKFLVKEEIIIIVQVNGKLRGNIKVQSSSIQQAQNKVQSYVEDLAKKDPNVSKHLEGKSIKKTIYVEGKVINFVV
jgi:leucyl-tRNA synthetase